MSFFDRVLDTASDNTAFEITFVVRICVGMQHASLRADAIDESIRREMESSASVNQVPLDIFC